MDVDAVADPFVTLFSLRCGGALIAIGALKELDSTHGELKSMHTAAAVRRQGFGRAMLDHLLEVAAQRGYRRVSLETGAMDAFAAARSVYRSVGFEECEPFANYWANPHSICMTKVVGRTTRVATIHDQAHERALIRDARDADLPAIVDMYNESILTTTTWSDQPQTLRERKTWFAARVRAGDAVLVAETAGNVVGFAGYSEFRDNAVWPGYRFTVETPSTSTGPSPSRRRPCAHGISGRASRERRSPCDDRSDRQRELEFDRVPLLARLRGGRILRNVGWKFDRWLDLVLLHKIL